MIYNNQRAAAMKRDIATYVGDRIRMARLARRLSQRDVAEMCKITAATLCKIERGETDVKLSTLALICSALALDITIGTIKVRPPR